MEVTIHYNGQAVAVEVTLEVYEFLDRADHKAENLSHEQRRHWDGREFDEYMERIKRRKAQGLQDRYLYDYTFANDNGQNPLMDKARAYVENWKEAYRNNTGLLLFGDVGTGKSFFAGCIANALLDRDVPVLMTNFPTILNRLTGMFSEDRADFIASFDEYDLLIIDDLGVERSTEYAMEQKAVENPVPRESSFPDRSAPGDRRNACAALSKSQTKSR